MALRPPQLILHEIQPSIHRHGEAIRPSDSRVSYEYCRGAIRRVENVNSILSKIARVDQAIAVRLQPVRSAFLTVGHNTGLCKQFGEGRLVRAQKGGGDTVEVRRANGRPEQCGTVGGKCDPVRSGCRRAIAQTTTGNGIRELAPDRRRKLGLPAYGGMAVKMTPGGGGAEIDRDKTIAAFRARISNIGDTKPGRSYGRAKVKADVVEVLESEVHD